MSRDCAALKGFILGKVEVGVKNISWKCPRGSLGRSHHLMDEETEVLG